MSGFGDVRDVFARLLASGGGRTGFALVLIICLAALFAPAVSTHDPDALDVLNRFAPPSPQHWLGTDHLGRDLFSRLVHGSTVAMEVALSAIGIALGTGALLGVLAATSSRGVERWILVAFDIVSSFPSLVLALAVVAVLGPSTLNVILIAGVTLIPSFGRVARAQVLTIQNQPFLEAERLLGASTARILRSHILPNIIGPLIVLAGMDIPVVITIEAGLSFIGLGVRPPLASWGTLVYDGYANLSDSTTPVVVSSLALAVATLGFTLFGEALRDAVDPRIRRDP